MVAVFTKRMTSYVTNHLHFNDTMSGRILHGMCNLQLYKIVHNLTKSYKFTLCTISFIYFIM